ncbi:MAG: DUF971 domain-containing protein [Planctomycetes bacterium]|nr:DUF971 domain-containing protein [Planctomycetota bacterium]
MAGPAPAAMRKKGDRELAIDWEDGHRSVYDVVELRRKCPCAKCVDEWSGKRLLDPVKIKATVRPVEIEPVGMYAIQIHWSDGHASGIYSFDFLRASCPCRSCGGPGALSIEPEELRRLLAGSETVVLLDVRTAAEHAAGRIPGARHADEKAARELEPTLPRESAVVFYCCPCDRPKQAAQWFRDRGITRTWYLAGGIDRWPGPLDKILP